MRHVDRRQPRIVECAIKATEFGDGEFHGRPRVVLDTDVAMAVDGVATFRAYQSDRFLGCGFDVLGDNHMRAPTGKNKGGRVAETARREERRGGKRWVGAGKSRWERAYKKK